MVFLDPDLRSKSTRHTRVYALYEVAYTAVDVMAAVLFIIGSVLFFSPNLQEAGTWCFLIGSIFFAAKPALRIVREIHLLRIGDYEDLAGRL